MNSNPPILVLDSGLGGLTVVRAMRKAMPGEDILYFGDTARLPYGSKSAATVSLFVRQIIEYFLPAEPKHVVIACNTATALALPAVRAAFPGLSISGVVEPGARAAIAAAGSKRVPIIGVLATEATIRSKAYEKAILRRRNHARLLLRAAPLLAPIVEDGRRCEDPLVRLALRQYLAPLTQHAMDVLVLGCTHYPILIPAIRGLVGEKVRVIDSAEQTAQDVATRLGGGPARAQRLGLSIETEVESSEIADAAQGSLRCYVTDDPGRFELLASRFLGSPIETPTWVSVDELAAAREPAIPVRRPA